MSAAAPQISVVMPNYNKAAFLSDAVKSMLLQTYSNWELLIIDDCSNDGSAALIREFAGQDSRIRFFLQKQNTGGNACRNLGLREARASRIMFFDSDDLLHPECLEQRQKFAEEHRGMDFWVYTLEVFKEKPGDNTQRWLPVKKNALDQFLKHQLPWQTMQPLYDTLFLRKQNGFDENFQRLQDVELHTRLLFVPGIRFEIQRGNPDCFFRISDERHVFHAFSFYAKRAEAVDAYIRKFIEAAIDSGKKNLLFGTWLKLMNEIAFVWRNNKVSKSEYQELKKQMKDTLELLHPNTFQRILLGLGEVGNESGIRIRGLNFAIEKLMEI